MTSAESVKYFYEVILSENKLERISDFISPACLLRTGDKLIHIGVEGMQEHIKATKRTFPDYTMKITRQFCEGDFVISDFLMKGTQEGEFLGIHPSHKKLIFFGVNIDKVVDGKIVEHSGAVNTFETLFEQHLIEPV